MKSIHTWSRTLHGLSAAALLATAGAAHAALVKMGDGTVKDTNTNLIWLQDWNVNGTSDYFGQQAWADNLTFAGSTEWRLPERDEYEALFAAYGNLAAVAQFTNVQQNSFYWSATQFQFPGGGFFFNANTGSSSSGLRAGVHSAVAVRAADVTTSVPEPQTLALALLALGATVVARRRPR